MSTSPVITPEVLTAALGQLLGIAPEQVVPTFERLATTAETVEQLQPMVVDQWRQQELGKLKSKWGEEFEPVYDYLTKEVFPNLPPEEQAKWNNADGLEFLAERHRDTITQRITNPQESKEPQPAPAATAPTGTITPGTGSANPGTNSTPVFTQSQLLDMSPDEWTQNESAIQQAYASGAVEMDLSD